MAEKVEKDMNHVFDTEHLYKSYFKMALPVVLGLIVTLVYNLADTFFIAGTQNTDLIAGVSLCAPVFTALMGFGHIYGQGGSSLISRMLGEHNTDGTKRISAFSFYGAIGTGFVLGLMLTLFSAPVLRLLGGDADTVPHAYSYYSGLALGAPVMVVSFVHQNLIRCEGLAKESMMGTVIGAVVNIILDPILISYFGMGAMGAAVATIIGYCSSVLFYLYIVRKRTQGLSLRISDCSVSAAELRQLFGIGGTAALSNLMQSAAVILVNQYLLPYGNDRIAAMGVVMKITMIATLIIVGFSFGGVPVFGYLYGARMKKELNKLVRFTFGFLFFLAVMITLILSVASPVVIGIFLKDSALIQAGSQMLRWQLSGTVCIGIVQLLTVLFQATGKVLPSFVLSISRQGIVFLVVIVVCASLFGYQGVIMSQPAADLISALIAVGLLIWQNPMKEGV